MTASESSAIASATASTIAGPPSTTATQLSAGVARTAQAAIRTTTIWTTPTTARPNVESSRKG